MRSRLADPAFEGLDKEIGALIDAAWDGYEHSRKSPRTQKAGEGYADPDCDLAVDWIRARDAIKDAQRRHDDASRQMRILLINGSSRSDQTCPGEMSKTYRLCKIAEPILAEHGYAVDFLDLSHPTSEIDHRFETRWRLIPIDRRDDHDTVCADPQRIDLVHPIVGLLQRIIRRI